MQVFKNFRDLVINKPYREHYRSQSRKILQPPSLVVTNIGRCKKVIRSAGAERERMCGNRKFVQWTAQTRSGDEGMTVFTQCTVCRSIKKS
jgi:DNA-directed RNA polymerase subunit M/transcription elongation factor TFIIS